MKQGTRTTEDFISDFETKARQADMLTNQDQYLIGLLEQNLNGTLVDRIYALPTLPDTFDEWKSKAITFDRLYRRRQAIKKASNPVPPRVQPRSLDTTPSSDVMDVDQSRLTPRTAGPNDECRYCHAKGHFIKDCPIRPPRPANWTPRNAQARAITNAPVPPTQPFATLDTSGQIADAVAKALESRLEKLGF
jgi:hypothetical protein